MRRGRKAAFVVKFLVAALVFGTLFTLVFGLAVMNLWNWLVPAVFGGKVLTFWQAVALLVLARLLVGGWRARWSGGGPHHWRRRMMERWDVLTPEERERFRAGVRADVRERIFGCEPPTPTPTPPGPAAPPA
jgi:hypothetical protein